MTIPSNSQKKLPPPLSPLTFLSLLYLIRDVLWIIICAGPILLLTLIQKIIPKRQKSLKGKIVLVTGAGSGLGRELSIQLSKLKCTVICVDIDKEANDETVGKISSFGGSSKAYYCDVSKSENVAALAKTVLYDYEKVDLVINNAGMILRKGILAGHDDEIKKVVEVNYLSSQWVTRAFLPAMIKQGGGHVVFISSSGGIHGLALANVYSSVKFALLGMTYSLIEEFRSNEMYKNIKVSCVMPYFMKTNFKYEDDHVRLRLPALPKETAVKLIIEGIRKEQKIFTIPGMTMGYFFSNVLRLLPEKLYHLIRDKFYTDFLLADETTHAGKNTTISVK